MHRDILVKMESALKINHHANPIQIAPSLMLARKIPVLISAKIQNARQGIFVSMAIAFKKVDRVKLRPSVGWDRNAIKGFV